MLREVVMVSLLGRRPTSGDPLVPNLAIDRRLRPGGNSNAYEEA